MKKFKLIILAISLLILVGFAPVMQGTQRFKEIITQTLIVTGNADLRGDMTLTDDLTIDDLTADDITADDVTFDALTAGAGITISDGNAVIADFARSISQTVLAMTDNGVITPTGSHQPISAAATTAGTLGGCATSTAGAQVTIVNIVAQAITITDTGNTVLSGNAVLNQYDTLVVLCDGTRWIQLTKTDN